MSNVRRKKSNISTEDKPKNLGGRPPKAKQYKKEREDIFNKLNDILGITDNNRTVYLESLDNDKDKIDKIMALKPDIQKYFKGRQFNAYLKNDPVKPYLCLIKLVYKECGYEVGHRQTTCIDVSK